MSTRKLRRKAMGKDRGPTRHKPLSVAVVHTPPTPGQLAAIEAMKDHILAVLLPGVLADLRGPEAA